MPRRKRLPIIHSSIPVLLCYGLTSSTSVLLSICLNISFDILRTINSAHFTDPAPWHICYPSKLPDLPWIWFPQELRIFISPCYFAIRIHLMPGSPLWLVAWCCELWIFSPPLCCYFIHFYVIPFVLDNVLWASGLCFQHTSFLFNYT